MGKVTRKPGVDTAWLDCFPQVDGRFRNHLVGLATAGTDLANLLGEAEHGAGLGQRQEIGVFVRTTGHPSQVEARCDAKGRVSDDEVQALRWLKEQWQRKLAALVREFQVDLGQAEPLRGPRRRDGRLAVVSSNGRPDLRPS
jgi:hypothetical protein